MPLPYIMINTITNFHKLQEGGRLKLSNKDLILSKIRLLSGVSRLDSHNLRPERHCLMLFNRIAFSNTFQIHCKRMKCASHALNVHTYGKEFSVGISYDCNNTTFCMQRKCKYFHVNNGNSKRFDVRVKALTVLDALSIRIKRTWERRINERVWKRHNAYGRRSISRICWLPIVLQQK